jgi:competence protein ComEA
MLKKSDLVSLKNFCLLSFVLIISAVFIFGTGITPAQAAKKVDAQKSISGPVDINSASQKDLEAIKGIGPSTAKKIISGRPYKSVDELSKAGLNAKAVNAIKPYVTVGGTPAPIAAVATKATAAKTSAAAKAAAAKTSVATTAATAKTSAVATTAAVSSEVTKSAKNTQTTAKSAATKLAPGTKININTADQSTIEKLPEIGPVKAKAIIAGRPYNSIEDVMKVKGIKGKTFDTIKDYIVVK